jgi:D-beta-D-heptose 7-phosphate kinase/D-beta-D-heptose 1-phosphate adenosyltransferase
VINNLNALGAQVDVISVIGNCETSDKLKALLANIKVSTKYLITHNKRITRK